MKPTRRKAARKQAKRSLWKSALLALPITAALSLLLLFLTAAILLLTKDPIRYYSIAGGALTYLSALLCGIVTATLYGRQSPLLCGVLSGAMLLLLLAVPCLLVTGGDHSIGMRLLLLSPLPVISLVGALLCCRRKGARGRR